MKCKCVRCGIIIDVKGINPQNQKCKVCKEFEENIKHLKELKRLWRLNSSVVYDSYGTIYRYTNEKPIVLDGEVILCLQSLEDFGYYYVNKNDLRRKQNVKD